MAYTTSAVNINADKPQQLEGKSAAVIVKYMHEHFKTNARFPYKPKNKATAYLKATFDALANPVDWKAPFYAQFPECGREWVIVVAIWYHADKGYKTFSGAGSHGYQAY